jgi:hypothetical protein
VAILAALGVGWSFPLGGVVLGSSVDARVVHLLAQPSSCSGFAAEAGGCRGFEVSAMVVTRSQPVGRHGWVWSPSVLPSVAESADLTCPCVLHGSAVGGHGCGLLSDAR